jgi:(p)ppGpp synthase/HD superfamily hydrolase
MNSNLKKKLFFFLEKKNIKEILNIEEQLQKIKILTTINYDFFLQNLIDCLELEENIEKQNINFFLNFVIDFLNLFEFEKNLFKILFLIKFSNKNITNDFYREVINIYEDIKNFLDNILDESQDIFLKSKLVEYSISKGSELTKVIINEFFLLLKNLNKYSDFIKNQLCEIAEQIFIPILHFVGLTTIKSKIEDIVMEITNNKDYNMILKKNIFRLEDIKNSFLKEFCKKIEKDLSILKKNLSISYRTKSISSIYKKIETQNINHENLHDYIGVRVVIDCDFEDEKKICYDAYHILLSKYNIDSKKTRDWVSLPKENGYSAIHVTIVYDKNILIEVQLRTISMHKNAEEGLACHWNYKGNKNLENLINKEILENLKKSKNIKC